MDASLSSALILMIVGMITVFSILGIVVLGGQILIRLTNRYVPEVYSDTDKESTSITDKEVAIISAVVAEVTNGHATHVKIDKI